MTLDVPGGLNAVLGSLTALSAGLQAWQLAVGLRFPLNQRLARPAFAPAVTLLKPLKGADPETEACLESWFVQDYAGPVQVLFGVASPDDPVCAVVEKLKAKFPAADARLIHCRDQLGANAKVSSLIHLEREARHEHLVISDADVWAPPDLLVNIVAPLAEPDAGLVNCFYRLANPDTSAMRWEAASVNADFWSQVLQSVALKPMDFALGAAMALRRTDLSGIGGFTALRNHLADDYQLGQRVTQSGKRIHLCPVVVDCREPKQGWKQVWVHQLRWARTIRICRPAPFFFSILGNASLWPALWLAAALPSGWHASQALPLAALFWRMLAALLLHRRFSPQTARGSDDGMVLLKDLLGTVIWAWAFLGNRIVWRGMGYKILRSGELVPLSEPKPAA
jgi:ceramide glucosyltransferase